MLSVSSFLLRNTVNKAISRVVTRPLFVSTPLKAKETEPVLEYREVTKDRSEVVPVETSVKYLNSLAYKQTYGDNPVWLLYRRNHKGPFPPLKTRKTCIRKGVISTGNPCPICRDEYLVLSEHNIDLLKQFISPHTGAVLDYTKTGLCQKKHRELIISIKRAFDMGAISYEVPYREYDYSEFY